MNTNTEGYEYGRKRMRKNTNTEGYEYGLTHTNAEEYEDERIRIRKHKNTVECEYGGVEYGKITDAEESAYGRIPNTGGDVYERMRI